MDNPLTDARPTKKIGEHDYAKALADMPDFSDGVSPRDAAMWCGINEAAIRAALQLADDARWRDASEKPEVGKYVEVFSMIDGRWHSLGTMDWSDGMSIESGEIWRYIDPPEKEVRK